MPASTAADIFLLAAMGMRYRHPSTKAVVLAHRGMHLPGATQPGSKHHQIAGPEPHRLTALGRDADITLQQQAGLLLVVGPGEGADPTAPGGPARHTQALQLGRIRVGRDGDAVGHGGAQKEWFQVSPATVPIELDAPLRRLEEIRAQRKRFASLGPQLWQQVNSVRLLEIGDTHG